MQLAGKKAQEYEAEWEEKRFRERETRSTKNEDIYLKLAWTL